MEQLIKENKLLQNYQSEEESEEIINQIPFLKISEINKNVDTLPTQHILEKYRMIFYTIRNKWYYLFTITF